MMMKRLFPLLLTPFLLPAQEAKESIDSFLLRQDKVQAVIDKVHPAVVGMSSDGSGPIGSAVIMPEVFLKAVSVARNKGTLTDDFLTCNFDMISHYRALTNVVNRPPKEGKNVIAMHEILLPLLHQALLATAASRGILQEPR